MVDKYKTNSVDLETLKISGTFGSYDALDSLLDLKLKNQ